MDEKFESFCESVCAFVKHATPEEKKEIAIELKHHLSDHTEALISKGKSEEEAKAIALEAMGNAEEIGRELNREFPLIYLVLSRASAIFATLIIISMALLLLLRLGTTYSNICARTNPASEKNATEGYILPNNINIKIEGPANDIIYFYSATVIEINGKSTAIIGLCAYDKNPFGQVSGSLIGNLLFTTPSGETFDYGGGSWNEGAAYLIRKILVLPGEQYIRVSYNRFGTQFELDIPLEWRKANEN